MRYELKRTGKLIYDEKAVQIILGIIKNETAEEISKRLFMARRTVENRVYAMRKLLKARSTPELILICYLKGIIEYELKDE